MKIAQHATTGSNMTKATTTTARCPAIQINMQSKAIKVCPFAGQSSRSCRYL